MCFRLLLQCFLPVLELVQRPAGLTDTGRNSHAVGGDLPRFHPRLPLCWANSWSKQSRTGKVQCRPELQLAQLCQVVLSTYSQLRRRVSAKSASSGESPSSRTLDARLLGYQFHNVGTHSRGASTQRGHRSVVPSATKTCDEESFHRTTHTRTGVSWTAFVT